MFSFGVARRNPVFRLLSRFQKVKKLKFGAKKWGSKQTQFFRSNMDALTVLSSLDTGGEEEVEEFRSIVWGTERRLRDIGFSPSRLKSFSCPSRPEAWLPHCVKSHILVQKFGILTKSGKSSNLNFRAKIQ